MENQSMEESEEGGGEEQTLNERRPGIKNIGEENIKNYKEINEREKEIKLKRH